MLDERAKRRDHAAFEIMRCIVRNSLRDLVPKRSSGERPFVVALHDDTLLETTNRVAMLGGEAAVFVLTEDGSMVMLDCTGTLGYIPATLGADDIHEVAAVSTMGQFAEYLEARDKPTAVTISPTPSTQISAKRSDQRLAAALVGA